MCYKYSMEQLTRVPDPIARYTCPGNKPIKPQLPNDINSDNAYKEWVNAMSDWERACRTWEGQFILFAFEKKRIDDEIAREDKRQENIRKMGIDPVTSTAEVMRRRKIDPNKPRYV